MPREGKYHMVWICWGNHIQNENINLDTSGKSANLIRNNHILLVKYLDEWDMMLTLLASIFLPLKSLSNFPKRMIVVDKMSCYRCLSSVPTAKNVLKIV
jgi:hypothetical protein